MSPSDALLREIEAEALRLATLAGAEITATIGRTLAVRYKTGGEGQGAPRDPVSEVDQHVETVIRAELAERFPEHDIIGEEMDERPGRSHDFVWAVDPIDGTANFVNGFPLYAASIGVLHQGRPVAGAIWCSASHKLHAGVYHARDGARLHFDSEELIRPDTTQVRRRLAGLPSGAANLGRWDVRKTGSAAIECAFVAAGLLEVAYFEAVNLWDVAGGARLALSAGCDVRVRGPNGWAPLERFETPDVDAEPGDLRRWRCPMLIGRGDALDSGVFD